MSETLEILPELRDLIPPLKDYELEQLHRSLDAEGCARDELTVWKQRNVIVDGHNRYAYCKEKGYDFTVRRISIHTMEEAKRFIILNQLGRRNLDPDMAAMLRGQLFNATKKASNDGGKGKNRSDRQSDGHSTAETIAEQTGVSARTVERDAKFAKAAEELGITADIVAGKCKLTRKEIVAAAEAKKNGGKAPKKTSVSFAESYHAPDATPAPGPYHPSIGTQFSRMALMDLEQIHEDDLERKQAFEEVFAWLAENAADVAPRGACPADAGAAMRGAWKTATRAEREAFLTWANGRGGDLPKGDYRTAMATVHKIRRLVKTNPEYRNNVLVELRDIIEGEP